MDYHFERLTNENFKDFVFLFNKVFKRKKIETYLKMKYNLPEGISEYYSFLVYHDNVAVGYAGTIIQILEINGMRKPAAQLVDVMTSTEHRRKGLFISLVNRVLAALLEDGINGLFALPNEQSHPVLFDKLGWYQSNTISRINIPIQSKYKSILKTTLLKNQRNVFEPFLSTTPPVHSFASTEFIKIERSKEYYDYKICTGGSFFLKIEKVILWVKLAGRNLYIGDMETPDDITTFKTIMEQLKKLASKAGMSDIIFQSSPGSRLFGYFDNCYTRYDSWTLGYASTKNTLKLDKLVCTFGDLDSY